MIRFENVSKCYGGGKIDTSAVLADINIIIATGQFVCILGPSGCGKTTLLNLVAGFIRPSGGRIRFNGAPVTKPGPDRGVVFQDANLFPWLTVRENVAFGLRQKRPRRNSCAEIADRYLERVGMREHANAYPHTLSGGMRQRTAIARVLALEPEALLMDEPFSSLDTNTREHLQDELIRIWGSERRTLVYVTHSVTEAAYLADRVIVMGPAPRNVHADIPIALARPRERSSEEVRRVITVLRNVLDELPCCIPPEHRSSRSTHILSSLPASR